MSEFDDIYSEYKQSNNIKEDTFDDIYNEYKNIQQAPQEPSFMDNVKDFGGKVLHKGKSVIDNAYNIPFMHDNSALQQDRLEPAPVENINLQPNTMEDRFNTPMVSFQKNNNITPMQDILYRNAVTGNNKLIKNTNNQIEEFEPTQYINGYSLEKANELVNKTFPNLPQFKKNDDILLQGGVFENTEYINPNQVAPQQQISNINIDNGDFNTIKDDKEALNNPENFNLSKSERENINKKLGLDGFYKSIHSGASRLLDGHDNIKQGIKHLVKAGVGTYTNAYDMLYMLGDKFDNDNLRNFAKQGYLVAEHLQNLIQTDKNSEGLKDFFQHPVRNINNLLADSTPLMGMAIGGSILAGGLATVASAPAWVVTLASGATAWAINAILQGDYIQKKRELETQLGRRLNAEETNNLQLATGVEKVIVGGLETCADMLGMSKFIGRVDAGVKNSIKNIVKKGVEQAIEEGLTEGLQETTSVLSEKSLDINKGNNLKRIAEATIAGGLLGGVMGGTGGAFNTRIATDKKLSDTDTAIIKTAPNTFAKQQAKEEAKQQAHKEQIENHAPNTVAEQKVKEEIKEAQKQEKQGHHTKDFNKGDIVRDIYSGHIYEVIEPDKRGMGKLRDVDTDEIRTPNAHNNAHYEKYEYNPEDLIEVEEFKYDPKENKRANSDLKTQQDYMYSKQEVVDAYNEYVKNPTEANKEKYEDVSGKVLKEFHDNKEAILSGTFNQRVENTEKVNTNEVAGNEGNIKNNNINSYKTEENGNIDTKGENSNGRNERTVLQQSGLEEKEPRVNEKSDRTGKSKSETSSNVSNIGRTDDSGVSNGRRLIDKHKSLIETNYKNQHELNKSIEDFINNKEYEVYNGELPQEIKDYLKKYAGAGGLEKQGAEGKGLLSEYYTPDNIVKKMWDLTAQYINTDGSKVLEPSVGIGRFLEYAPKGTNFDTVEMNPVSAKITELLYPNANVTVGQFQERFIDKSKNLPVKEVTPEYDIVIGNPPYGEYSGMYKGLGEGKKYRTIQAYFINRGLDTLKENGVMTFIVPSSFLENINDKLEISEKAELLDAYRLPEKTFDTTSIGTDIIVLRKRTGHGQDTNFISGNWFKKHPEKILGTQETRKNRFGKEEIYVKGDKNAVDGIDTSHKDIQETETVIEKHPEPKKQKTTKKTTKKVVQTNGQKNVEYNEYQHENSISAEDMPYYTDTRVDGTLPREKYKPSEKVNQFDGKLYNDFNYLQGDIYEKLDALDNEDISDKQKEIQRKKLESVLPKPKKLSEINITPSSDFVKEFYIENNDAEEGDSRVYLDRKYLDYVGELTNSERNGISVWDIRDFVNGKAVRTNYRGYSLSKEEKANQRAEFMTKLKNTVDKTFNDFINSELSYEDMQRLEKSWNRQFNNLYTPDYKKIPMIVKGLSDTFYGSKLKLQDVQVEGVNYLTNKGIGLLGFEVGVGKTLSGTIATVQNMQMGRCKKPLILVPKSVKPNWIREIHEAFPNIKINDVDNLSKFDSEIEDGSISVGTYQALDNLWYNDDTVEKLSSNTSKIRTDHERESTKRGREKSEERNAEFIGKAMQGNKMLHKVEDLGFDHITVDEAHNFKNLFGDAKADGQEGNTYSKITGAESTRAKRLFLLTQYILDNNNNRNVFMLTATPFNNSPLEVFNMLSYMAKDKLDEMGIYNVYQFMENYVDLDADWVVDSKNNVSFKQIAKGFKNLQSLQSVIDSCMLMRSADDAGIKRPNKITRQFALEPTEEQKKLIAKMEALAVGIDTDEEGNTRVLDKEEQKGAQLKAITKGRIATLSPDIFNNNLEVSPEDFIENSPKLNFVMKAIEANKKKDKKTSQIIYMPIGTDFLPKMKEYLVKKGIYKADEVAIIKGGITDDKINSITDSFNDREGKVKVIIGTNKIKEGMNLNKNSSVLYIPFIDWNPTDYVQVVGRIWRRGNRYKNVRIIVPTLNDSSDSFMYQKLDEKTSRINNIMDRGKDYIDTGELNASEEKINMITNPDKKAMMFSQIEQQKLENKISNLKGQLDDARHYQRELERAKSNIKYQQEGIDRNTEKLKNIEDKESWQYSSTKNYLDMYKKDLKKAEKHLEYIENKIKRLELDFEGKDSEENIQKQIEAVQKEIENLKETTELKRAEYKDEYERNRKEGKKLEDYIVEFEKETDELLKSENNSNEVLGDNDLADIDIPEFMKNQNDNIIDYGEDINLAPVYEGISRGIKGKDLAELLPDKIADIILNGAKNYTFGEMITKDSKKKGVHQGKKTTIKLNIEAIGNSPYKFIKTLTHEIKHAEQHKLYLSIMAKPKNTWTPEERTFIAHYNNCKRVNKNLQKHYNKHKNLIDRFDNSNFYSAEERINAISKLSKKEQDIIDTYDTYYEDYKNDFFELEADTEGVKNATEYRKKSGYTLSRPVKTKQDNIRGPKERDILADNGNSAKEEQFSTEQSEYKQVENSARQDEIKIEKATRDSLYKWYGEVGKARFDVDKDLNNFNKITKSTAKDFSNKTGLKVSDKMIREILPFLRERTGVPEALGRKDLSKFYNKLDKNDIARLTKLADDVCAKFDKYWQNYKDAKGILTEEDIENHISHIWKTTKSQKSILTNYFNTNSRFAKPRTIESLVKGIEAGLKPRTLDIGEILKIQSDSLIKSANDSILANTLKKMRYNKEIMLQPSSKAPADWVEINHPALSKAVYSGSTDDGIILSRQPVKVHPAVAEIIAPVFEVQKADNLGWKVYDNINGTLKQVQLGFSGFHGFALTESSIGNSYLKDTLKHLNPKKFVDAIKNDNYDIFKQEKIAKDGIEHGLKLGTPSDLNRSNVEKFLSHIPFVGKLTEANNKILWDCLHNSFKIEAYKIKCEEVGKDITDEQKRSIAQWVNDSFGGQAWELLGVKNSTVKGLSRALLSPDWLISTTRQFMGMTENVPMSKWLEKCDIKALRKFAKLSGISDIGDNIGVRGKSARKFWATAMVFSVLFYNLINAMFRAKDRKEHPEYYTDNSLMSYTIWDNALPGDKLSTKIMPYIFIGRNKDGSARYLRLGKQFREVPELMSEPVSKLSMKSATVPSAIANIGLGYSVGDVPKKLAGKDTDVYYNQEIWNGYGKFAKKKQGLDLYKGMGKTALKSVAPFVVNNVMNEKHNMSAWDVFAQTSNGLGYTKAKNQYLYAYEHGNKSKDFEKITQRGMQDGMSYKKLKSAQKKAETEYTQELVNKYSSQYVSALKSQNQSKINKVADKLEKENVPANIRVKVYKSALKEYRKSVR